MKIIFLDIDGVLNVNLGKGYTDKYGDLFHPILVENLKLLIEKTDAKIVVSSTWKSKGVETLKEMWVFRNLPGEIIDITPYCDEVSSDNNNIYYDDICRGDEIRHWLDRNPVSNYVILDDEPDMLSSQSEKFIRTSNNNSHDDSIFGLGLTLLCVKKAIEILNN